MIVRPMRVADASEVAAILSNSFPSHLARYMAYSQRGTGAFLEDELNTSGTSSAKVLLVAEHDGGLVAFAEYRLTQPTTAFLSYICVTEHARRRGLARALIEQFLTQHPQVSQLHLDVFEHNEAALRLYDRLGFMPIGKTVWYRRDLPAPTQPLRIENLQAMTAEHARYGFSQLQINRGDCSVQLGRIGDAVIRCFEHRTFADDAFLAGLRASLPQVTEAVLITTSANSLLPDESRELVRSHRMAWERPAEPAGGRSLQ